MQLDNHIASLKAFIFNCFHVLSAAYPGLPGKHLLISVPRNSEVPVLGLGRSFSWRARTVEDLLGLDCPLALIFVVVCRRNRSHWNNKHRMN